MKMAGVIRYVSVVLTLALLASSSKSNHEPPVIVEPASQISLRYAENAYVSIKCRAVGNPEPKYEWRRDGRTINSPNIFFNTLTGVLTIRSLSATEEGIFTCHATNHISNDHPVTVVSADVELHVIHTAKSSYETFYAWEGDHFLLECDAEVTLNYGTSIFKWYLFTADDNYTEINEDKRIFIDQKGGLHFSFILKTDETRAGTRYRCGVLDSNQAIVFGGQDCLVLVNGSGALQYSTTGDLLEVSLNTDAVLECVFGKYISGTVQIPEVKWYNDTGDQIFSGGRYSIASDGRRLMIARVQESDEKVYSCRGTSDLGSKESRMYLNVTHGPIWEKKPLEKQIVVEGESVTFTCVARSVAGENPPDSPEWFINGYRIGSNYDSAKYIFNQDKTEMTVVNVRKSTDTSCFQCRVSNSKGSELANGCLIIIQEIVIVRQPSSLIVFQRGDVIDMTVEATSDPSTNLTYEWTFRNKTYDNLHPPPHVKIDVNTRETYINTSELRETDVKDITGVYRLNISNQYQHRNVSIELHLVDNPHPNNDGPLLWIEVPTIGAVVLICIVLLIIFVWRKYCSERELEV